MSERTALHGLLLFAPAVRELLVRSTPPVADSGSAVALYALSLLSDCCENCNLFDFTVLLVSLQGVDPSLSHWPETTPLQLWSWEKSSVKFRTKTEMESWKTLRRPLAWDPKVSSDGWVRAKSAEWGVSVCSQIWATLQPHLMALLPMYKEKSTKIQTRYITNTCKMLTPPSFTSVSQTFPIWFSFLGFVPP